MGRVDQLSYRDRGFNRPPLYVIMARTGIAAGIAAGTLEHLNHLVAHFVKGYTQAFEHPGSYALPLSDQAQQQVLGADVVVVQPPCLVNRQLDYTLGTGCQPDLAHHHAVPPPDDELDSR